MNVFLLGFLFVIVMPLAEGVLFALLLREIHMRHPLPLGGVIETEQRRQIRAAKQRTVEAMEVKRDLQQEPISSLPTPSPLSESINQESSSSLGEAEKQESVPSAIDVFDEATRIPDNLPVNEVLDLMVAEAPTDIPNDFENRIDAAAQTVAELPSGISGIHDDMDADDLDALAAALPRQAIDFTQELDTGSAVSQPISRMAKELLGENFDFDVLEAQSSKLASLAGQKAILSDSILDIQENEAGTVQVSSRCMSSASPKLADLITPQTILPTFADGWIQEAVSMDKPTEGNNTMFCFTEESPPMFVRKKKSG